MLRGVFSFQHTKGRRRRKSHTREKEKSLRTRFPHFFLRFDLFIYYYARIARETHAQKERDREKKQRGARRRTLRAEKERATFKKKNHDRRHGDAFARERRRDEADHAESVRGNQTVRGEARTGRPGGGFTGTVPNERFV